MNLCKNVDRANQIINLQLSHARSHVHDIIIPELYEAMALDVKTDEVLSIASAQLGYGLRPDQELVIKHHPRKKK